MRDAAWRDSGAVLPSVDAALIEPSVSLDETHEFHPLLLAAVVLSPLLLAALIGWLVIGRS